MTRSESPYDLISSQSSSSRVNIESLQEAKMTLGVRGTVTLTKVTEAEASALWLDLL